MYTVFEFKEILEDCNFLKIDFLLQFWQIKLISVLLGGCSKILKVKKKEIEAGENLE